jgi:hypothetical protein
MVLAGQYSFALSYDIRSANTMQCFPATKKRSAPVFDSKRDFLEDLAKVVGFGKNATLANGTLANTTLAGVAATTLPAPVSAPAPKETTARNYGQCMSSQDMISNMWDLLLILYL